MLKLCPSRLRLLLPLLAAVLMVCGCGNLAPAAKPHLAAPTTSFRFVVIADTHFGYEYEDLLEPNRRLVRAIRAYPGAKPSDVLICGDLTEHGTPEQWKQFLSVYGPGSKLGLPIKFCTGNHDLRTPANILNGNSVVKAAAKLNRGSRHRWRRGGIEFFCLGLKPSVETSLWLDEQLTALGPNAPVILMMHIAPVDPFSKQWTSRREETVYQSLLEKHSNILAVFYGHMHYTDHVRHGGIDHFTPGSPKHRDAFLVVDVTPGGLNVQCVHYAEHSPITFDTLWTGQVTLGTQP